MIRFPPAEAEAMNARNKASWTKSTKTELVSLEDIFGCGSLTEPVKAAKKAKAAPVPTEHAEQCAVIKWCDTQPLARFIFAIPNGANKSMASAVKFKREGLRKGVPDLFLPIPNFTKNYAGLFIEMKRVKASVTSKEQLAWLRFLQTQNFACHRCHGAEQAIEVIKEYLK